MKWTDRPKPGDCCHLLTFLDENSGKARRGYVICRCPRPMQLDQWIIAWPWSHL